MTELVSYQNYNTLNPSWKPSYQEIQNIQTYWMTIFSYFPFTLFQKFYLNFILGPLFALYFSGHSLGGYGFWEGRPFEDICQELTKGKVDSAFWVSSPQAYQKCQELAMNAFYQFVFMWATLVYLLLFLVVIWFSVRTIKSSVLGISHTLYQVIKEKSRMKRRRQESLRRSGDGRRSSISPRSDRRQQSPGTRIETITRVNSIGRVNSISNISPTNNKTLNPSPGRRVHRTTIETTEM